MHATDWLQDLGFPLINFGIFSWILWRYGKEPLRNFLNERRQEFLRVAEDSLALKLKAEERAKSLDIKISGLDQELQERLVKVKTQAEAEARAMTEEALKAIELAEKESRRAMDQRVSALRNELRLELIAELESQLKAELIKDPQKLDRTFLDDKIKILPQKVKGA